MATIAQPRNPIVDIADIITKLSPTFLGSGKTTQSTSSYLPQFDPAAAGQSDALFASLMQRANSTAQADKIVEDIMFRAQLAFSPILGEEKQAGLYNTSTRQALAKEAVARATAASAQAVLEDQQRALQTAAQVSGTRMQAASAAQTAGKSTTTTSRTAPQVKPKNLLTGMGVGMAGNFAMKKGAEGIKKLFENAMAPGAGIDSGDLTDVADNLYNSDSIEDFLISGGSTGAVNPMHTAGDFGPANFGGANGEPIAQIPFQADDTAALQQIIDSANVPVLDSESMTQLAQLGGSTLTDAAGDVISESLPSMSGAEAAAIEAASGGAISAEDAVTIGPIGAEKAMEAFNRGTVSIEDEQLAAAFMQQNPALQASQDAVEAAIAQAGLEPGSQAAEELALSMTNPPVDPFAFDEVALDFGANVGGDVAAGSGITIASQALDAELAGYDALMNPALDAGFDFAMPGIPYFTIANAVTGGKLGEAVMDIPIVGDALGSVGEAISDIPIVGDAVSAFSEGVSDVVEGGMDIGEDLLEGAGDFFEDVGDFAGDIVGGGKIVCTEAVRQGLLSADLVKRETYQNIVVRKISPVIIRGYHYLGTSWVLRMRRDPVFAKNMTLLAKAYCEYITGERRTVTGWILRYAGEALCWLVGKLIPADFDYRKVLNGNAST